ncbi:MAG: hypothetical protein ACE5KM_12715 [Planctomycetaceae bacterium]
MKSASCITAADDGKRIAPCFASKETPSAFSPCGISPNKNKTSPSTTSIWMSRTLSGGYSSFFFGGVPGGSDQLHKSS